ncbi:hypothetical protein [Protaetiibacter mangrovi]|uniref:Lipoprotein n=1 Tax=Protaetiibacter mangrovi TaxID=2970926 RepID=A0ABT1ZIR7_9MICO|nr:hypothetical protein [Protaetiibacter mangrovi]MCS0500577.1 hypothetical protein [Protaetiibacter mangrovi]TPX03253.1 hypothetical protein FJ656_18180 [Schumannella luteola]
MRRTARLLPPALALLLLTACTTPAPMPTLPPTPDADPVFASDEEALAAAEEAYGKYLTAVATVLADGGSQPERLEPFLTADLYAQELPAYEELQEQGWKGVGTYSFAMTPQDVDASSGDIAVYVCDDRSNLDIVDETGNSVVDPGRPDRAASEVLFVWNGGLRIAAQTSWDGGGVC